MIWHPYTPQKSSEIPILIQKAKNEFLYDQNGKEYIDCISSWWISIHGHNNSYLINSIKKQLDNLDHVLLAGFTNQPAMDLAEKLLSFTENQFHSVFYSDNGSCAIEISVKIAYQYYKNLSINRSKILHFSESYHGDTIGTMSLGGLSPFNSLYQDLFFKSPEFKSPDCYFCPVGKVKERCKEECLDELELYLHAKGGEIFAIIIEPLIQGANGMKIYKKEVLQKLSKFCKHYDIILIFDEVFTGFGRTGSKFAFLEAGVVPDIIALAKGLSGGVLPLAATLVNEKIYSAFDSIDINHTFMHGHTMTGNPPACASALASIELFENENRLEDIKILEFHLKKYVNQLSQKFPELIQSVRVLGAVCAFEIQNADPSEMQAIKHRCLENGLIIRPLGNTIYITPPYIISKESLVKIFMILETVFKELYY
jgi:adenosylmethionine---8-amino-7-oxononanoate aminotransferase